MFWVFAFGAIAAVFIAALLVGLNRAVVRRAARRQAPYTERQAMHAANLAEAFPHTREN